MKIILYLFILLCFLGCKLYKHNSIIGEWELVTFKISKRASTYKFDSPVSALIPNQQDFVIEYKNDNTFISKDYAFNPIKIDVKGKYQMIENNEMSITQISDNKEIVDTVEYSILNDTLILILPQYSFDTVLVQKFIKEKCNF